MVFYKEGKPIKSLSTKDLRTVRVRKSISHYQCIQKVLGFDGHSNDFVIKLIDGKELVFDAKRGIAHSKAALPVNRSAPSAAVIEPRR